MSLEGCLGTVTQRWRWGGYRKAAVTQISRKVVSLFIMLTEDSRDLLGAHTCYLSHHQSCNPRSIVHPQIRCS